MKRTKIDETAGDLFSAAAGAETIQVSVAEGELSFQDLELTEMA